MESVDIKSQLCKMEKSGDLLYNIVPLVNNTVLCTLKFKRIDLTLNVLITVE